MMIFFIRQKKGFVGYGSPGKLLYPVGMGRGPPPLAVLAETDR